MDKVTQSTAASAEESAAASEDLNTQAEQMKVYVVDLAKVVEGGSANGAVSFHSALDAGHRSKGVSMAVHKALPLPEKKDGGKAAGRVQRAKAVRRPEEVIPLTEGEFKDF
jgi:methyl-accepting chemotaxis protein